MIEYNDITLRLVNPRDKRNTDQEQYYLNWVSINGGVKDWLFTPPNDTSVKSKGAVLENDSIFRNIITGNSKEISLVASNLSLDEFNYIEDIFQSNKIELNTTTGEVKEIVLLTNRINKSNDAHVYRIELSIMMRQNNIMKG